jgi:hypothetical protein
MSDARALADEAVHKLDRLAAVLLEDAGEGPTPQDLLDLALSARDAVAGVGIPAFNELSGLVTGAARSIVAGTTDWSPSFGGTLMAAVDDLRALVMRADQFSDEDSEHLHQRAAELAVYVSVSADAAPVSAPPSSAPSNSTSSSSAPMNAAAATPAAAPSSSRPAAAAPTNSAESAHPISPAGENVIPISDLFFSDQGPHVVSGGVPKAAAKTSDLLGAGIDALENLTAEPLAVQAMSGPMAVVPVESLLYRGRAALERAAAIREQIKTSGTQPSPAALDEMYDLIALALKD